MTFEERIQEHLDNRRGTLARIKARSLGADTLTLTALNVLVYAQLEGGIKDLAACVLRDINSRHVQIGDMNPALLEWRNPEEIIRFKSIVDFRMIALPSPFSPILSKRLKLKGINRRYELNQMSYAAIRRVYNGLKLDSSNIDKTRTVIDDLVDDRNDAAHHGMLPTVATVLMEKHVRENADVVETVLTDFSIQLLPFFTNKLHLR